nr:hypothetical protein [Tanacetum cinerariifolium]
YGVFMHNKSTATPNSTYLSPTVISSLLDFIQTLLDETPVNELTDLISHPVYTDPQTTSLVHNPEGNHELTSYISGASKVPLGTLIDVLPTKNLMQEMFLDENAPSYTISTSKENSLSYNISPTKLTTSQSKEADAKSKKEYKEVQLQEGSHIEIQEYDQKLEALTNFNVSKAFEKVVKAKVLTKIKKLIPTHVLNAIANYVKPHRNTSVLEVMILNQINLLTQSSTSTDDLT